MKYVFALLAAGMVSMLSAQTHPRGWYADGQVWIVFDVSLPLPETMGIYASPGSFDHVDDAVLVGRPFHLDYLPTALKEQVDTSSTYRIPDGNGGTYQLAPNEGLFVYTPHQAGAVYVAVVPYGETEINASDITTDPITFQYDPVNDPVECHLQATFPSPFSPVDYRVFAYYMWCDGRADHRDARPDFPVMANLAKNGMAGFFFVSVPVDIDTTHPFPMTVWLHGGGGTARQSLAGSREIININPDEGILVAHNDDVFGYRNTTPPFIENPSAHFGYRENWDPFSPDNLPLQPDTVINYSQRKYRWIEEWLIRRFNVDPARVHLQGHSMGSWGATGLAKAYPADYASVVIFNNAFRGHVSGNFNAMLGDPALRFPTNLVNRVGGTVHYPDMFDLNTNVASQRDLPVFKSFHSKNDVGEGNNWGVSVVADYQVADAAGHGMALYWSERGHGVDTGPDYDDHWVNGNDPDRQTAVDDVAYGESHYRSDVSYPAFFNHRLDPNANDPGDGTPGTSPNGSGDDWGTWGGWHRWDTESIIDLENAWSVEAWLESEAVFENDNCPHDQLTADLIIRRPQHFSPQTGEMVYWWTENAITVDKLQSGVTVVADDDLVRIEDIVIYREELKKVRINVIINPNATVDMDQQNALSIYPNPASGKFNIRLHSDISGACEVRIMDMEGQMMSTNKGTVVRGENSIVGQLSVNLVTGIYTVQVLTEDKVIAGKLFFVRGE